MNATLSLASDAQALLDQELHGLLENGTGIYAVFFSTIDGHAVAHATQAQLPESKFAAMTSSLIALGESVAHEGNQRACQYVVIVNSDGIVATRRCGKYYVLSILARKDTNLGMVLSSTRATIDHILTFIQ